MTTPPVLKRSTRPSKSAQTDDAERSLIALRGVMKFLIDRSTVWAPTTTTRSLALIDRRLYEALTLLKLQLRAGCSKEKRQQVDEATRALLRCAEEFKRKLNKRTAPEPWNAFSSLLETKVCFLYFLLIGSSSATTIVPWLKALRAKLANNNNIALTAADRTKLADSLEQADAICDRFGSLARAGSFVRLPCGFMRSTCELVDAFEGANKTSHISTLARNFERRLPRWAAAVTKDALLLQLDAELSAISSRVRAAADIANAARSGVHDPNTAETVHAALEQLNLVINKLPQLSKRTALGVVQEAVRAVEESQRALSRPPRMRGATTEEVDWDKLARKFSAAVGRLAAVVSEQCLEIPSSPFRSLARSTGSGSASSSSSSRSAFEVVSRRERRAIGAQGES